MWIEHSINPSTIASRKTLRCHFCARLFRTTNKNICERVIQHMESVHPDEALPFAKSDAIVLDALARGLSVLPWEGQ